MVNSRAKGATVKITENMIQSQIRDYLRLMGWYVIRNQQGLGSHKGLADLTAIKNGCTVWVEVKKPKGILSEDQVKFMAEVEAHGGIYMIVRDVIDVEWWAREKHPFSETPELK